MHARLRDVSSAAAADQFRGKTRERGADDELRPSLPPTTLALLARSMCVPPWISTSSPQSNALTSPVLSPSLPPSLAASLLPSHSATLSSSLAHPAPLRPLQKHGCPRSAPCSRLRGYRRRRRLLRGALPPPPRSSISGELDAAVSAPWRRVLLHSSSGKPGAVTPPASRSPTCRPPESLSNPRASR